MKPELKSSKDASPQAGRSATGLPFNIFSQSEFLLWPYRSLSKVLLRTHHNAAELLEINRKLADELREIIRRQQDFALEFSERLLNAKGNDATARAPERVNEYFDSAIASVREFGQAIADAQVHSIEALRDHTRKAVAPDAKAHGQTDAAA
jgi:hypothetical protein